MTNSYSSSKLLIAVVSDLHAYDPNVLKDETPSYLHIQLSDDQPGQHPILALKHLISKDRLKADLLVCCGDITNKALPAGMQFAWTELQGIKASLGAKRLVATPGNHDVDSRYEHSEYDARGVLQSLPEFPINNENLADKFWSRNFVVFTERKYRGVLLNTSAYHGQKEGEFEHGRVSKRTLERLKAELEMLEHKKPRAVNLLVCHHHPHKFGDIDVKDYSVMEGGHQLLELLASGNYGNWLIIHGHKHHPRIVYATGGAAPPIIFSAGSLTAVLGAGLQTRARNQFYLLTLPIGLIEKSDVGLVGTFQAWDWSLGNGWIKAKNNSGLPGVGGFGFRGSIDKVSNAIARSWKKRNEPFAEWKLVASDVPDLEFLMPMDLELLSAKLQKKHGLHILRNGEDKPEQIGKPL